MTSVVVDKELKEYVLHYLVVSGTVIIVSMVEEGGRECRWDLTDGQYDYLAGRLGGMDGQVDFLRMLWDEFLNCN